MYRLTASAGDWKTWVPNSLATARAGERTSVEVWAKPGPDASRTSTLHVRAVSESDPDASDTAKCHLR